MLFATSVSLIVCAHYAFRLNGVVAFWLAYILTRPLGASFGDLLSQPTEYGGLGFGTLVTSALFLVGIVGLVIFLTAKDQDGPGTPARFSAG